MRQFFLSGKCGGGGGGQAGSPGILQNLWETFSADSGGPLTAQDPNDVLDVIGGSGISTTLSLVGSPEVATLTISATGSGGLTSAYTMVSGSDGGSAMAIGADNINFVAGSPGIRIVASQTGSPQTTDVTITNTAPAPAGLSTTVINGQTFLTLIDETRLEGSPETPKVLSVAEQPIQWAENGLSNLDWVRIGNANDAETGYIADFDGTVVYATAHCENTGANGKEIHLYINGTDVGSIGTLSGGTNATFINTTANIDFSQGDRLRLRAVNTTGGSPPPGNGPIQDTVIKLTLKWRG